MHGMGKSRKPRSGNDRLGTKSGTVWVGEHGHILEQVLDPHELLVRVEDPALLFV